ncbi:hypothetical protein KSC_073720 [Ktedonobacter sp. SOSP1-52]|nr:hypothetical protein KSC_073720 [Ktedonobacter sp. SOSP1-52]
MRDLVGKAHNLILNRGAVARPNTFDDTGIEGGAMQVITNNLMGALSCSHQVAGQLRTPAA